MSLHPQVLGDLLDDEVDVARHRLGERVTSITVNGGTVEVTFVAQGATWHLHLEGSGYDRLPLSLSFVDEAGAMLPATRWPAGVPYDGLHPVLNKPWTCLRGTLEYHLFPGHTAGDDGWDANRDDHRVGDVIDHVLQRCAA